VAKSDLFAILYFNLLWIKC